MGYRALQLTSPCPTSFTLRARSSAAFPLDRYKPEPMAMFDFRAERVLASIDESLARLGLEYIDVGQVVAVQT
jgi:aryl-alcohol dehydrogenase-like predicted oxidoreductase